MISNIFFKAAIPGAKNNKVFAKYHFVMNVPTPPLMMGRNGWSKRQGPLAWNFNGPYLLLWPPSNSPMFTSNYSKLH